MKISEIASVGTYVGVRPTLDSEILIFDWIKSARIKNPVTGDLHSTVLYSRKPVTVKPDDHVLYHAVPVRCDLFNNADGTVSLVLCLDSPGLTRRHSELISLGGTHDYDSFEPHITVSYDAGGTDLSTLPALPGSLCLTAEYVEDLNLNWHRRT